MRVNVYVDGFNLYYGAVKGTKYKWLDLGKLSAFLFPGHTIHRIRYFTALIHTQSDPQAPQRQQAYLRAIETIPNLSVHLGIFLSHPTQMPLHPPPESGSKTARVLRTDEKGSDVNLATYLLTDAFEQDYEMAAVISNDSDLAFPIEVVRQKFGLDVEVLCPHKRMSWTLGQVASAQRPIRERLLRVCQFADVLTDRRGRIHRPPGW